MGGDQQADAQQDEPQDRWGDPISEERQRELQGYLDRWESEQGHGDRKGPFDPGLGKDGVSLTGADVYWLVGQMPDVLRRTRDLHLEGANLWDARLQGASLMDAHLEGANLEFAHLQGASLIGAHLQGASLIGAHLEKAELMGAHLEGATIQQAHLEGVRLAGAWLDSKTVMARVSLDATTWLGDIQWGGVGAVNLTDIDWNHVRRVGEEASRDWGYAARAYRQLAAQLRAQGMTEVADRFAYRALLCQRRDLLERVHLPQYLGSWLLAILAGYGYRPGRTILWYLVVIVGFAFAYYQATHGLPIGPYHFAQVSDIQALQPNEALILSISSFHGRGFFQPIKSLGDPVATLAAAEAIIGLLIEISFIATFTQRFFGAR